MLSQRDAVGLGLFDSELKKLMPPRSAGSYLQTILRELDTNTGGEDTKIQPVLHAMADRLKRKGLIILISDLYDDPDEVLSGLRHFRYNQHEVLVFHLLDPQELNFEYDGDVEFEDMESGEKIRTYPWYIKAEYKEALKSFEKKYRNLCREHQIDYQLMGTDQSLDVALMEFLIKRQKLG
jgi:uncharacterized protein (DUF58 family)